MRLAASLASFFTILSSVRSFALETIFSERRLAAVGVAAKKLVHPRFHFVEYPGAYLRVTQLVLGLALEQGYWSFTAMAAAMPSGRLLRGRSLEVFV
jgi:hypothetical protein